MTKFNIHTNIENKYPIFYLILFLYILFPFRFFDQFTASNQIEEILITLTFSGILFLFTLIKANYNRYSVDRIDLSALIYWLYCLCRSPFPFDKEWLFQYISLFFIYCFFRNLLIKNFHWLFYLIPLAGVVQIAEGISKFSMPWHNLSHITGIFYNTGIFGGFISIACTVCLGFIITSKPGEFYSSKIFWLIVFSFLTVQLIYSNSRASWIAAGISGIYLLFQYRGQFITKWKIGAHHKMWAGLIILIFSVFFSISLYQMKKDSADGRLLIGKISSGMIADNPLLGNGIHGFRSDYMNYQARYFRNNPDSPARMLADDVVTPFNEYLKITIECGITGLLLFLLLLFFVFRNNHNITESIREKDTLTKTKSILISILVFAIFSYPFDQYPFLVLFVSCIAITARNPDTKYSFSLTKINRPAFRIAVMQCFFIGRNLYFLRSF